MSRRSGQSGHCRCYEILGRGFVGMPLDENAMISEETTLETLKAGRYLSAT